MNKINHHKNFDKKTNLVIFFVNFFITFFIVKNYSNFLEPFEDEITSLLSGLSFLDGLNFDGSPLIIGNYSPYLTSGPLASLGGAIGWKLSSDFVISRLSNFYFLLLIAFIFLKKTEIGNKENNFLNLNILYFSVLLLPWWFGTLYSLGEVISSVLFTISILLIRNKTNLALLLMGVTVIFGKTLQILLLIPFLFTYFLFFKKINTKNVFFIFLPFLTYILILNFKVEDFDLIKYFKEYLQIITSHQSSGVDTFNLDIFKNFLVNLSSSEFNQWTLVTKIRVFISPLIFCMILIFESKNLNKLLLPAIPLAASIFVPYLWFVFVSDTKWIRYSQHYLFLIVFFSILIITYEFKISKLSFLFIFTNISIFMSSTAVFILFLSCILSVKNTSRFKNYFLIVLLINSFNILNESNQLKDYDLNFQNCEIQLNSIECINEYLQYQLPEFTEN